MTLAGMYCSTATGGWAGSFIPARMVIGSATLPAALVVLLVDPDAFLLLSESLPQAAPTARTATITAVSAVRRRRDANTPMPTSARANGDMCARSALQRKGSKPAR